MQVIHSLRASWRAVVAVLTPFLLLPLVFPYSETSAASKCGGLVVLMAVYWITESLPLPATSLLPLALCPILGIASAGVMCKLFFGDVTFMLIGGIFVAIAIEESHLHKRMALKILMLVGLKPRRLLLGIMLTTAFLSMWISNTATTAMMMPIIRALLSKLFSSSHKAQQKAREICGESIPLAGISASLEPEPDIVSEELPTAKDKREISHNSKHDDPHDPGLDHVPSFTKLGDLTTVFRGVVADTATSLDQPQQHLHHHPLLSTHSERPQGDQHSLLLHTQMEQFEEEKAGRKNAEEELEAEEDIDDEEVLDNLSPQELATLKSFSLCVCYSASVGGVATLTGTAPNMVLSRMVAEMTKDSPNPVTFAGWLTFGLPVTLCTLILTYVWMNINVFGLTSTLTCKDGASPEEVQRATDTINAEYKKLGHMKFGEKIVLVHFLTMVALWLTRNPGSFPGWGSLFQDKYASDGQVAIAVALSLFVFPRERPNVLFFREKGDTSPPKSVPAILTWKQASRKFPWGVAFLLGGGFALSKASEVSGLSNIVAQKLMFIQDVPLWTASLIVTTLTSFVTEITSNTVITMLILPILRDIAMSMEVHPLYLMLPAAVASSLAFMLPVATPPNALVFAYGDVQVTDMMKSGVILNFIGIAVVAVGINTWGYAYFGLQSVPPWATPLATAAANATNFTLTTPVFDNFTLL